MNDKQATRQLGLVFSILGVLAFGILGAIALASPDHAAAAAPGDDQPEPKQPDSSDGPSTETEDGIAPELRRLTDKEINRIRYMELRAMRGLTGVDPVTVKVSREVQDEFLVDMTGHDDFRGKRSRRSFLKRTPPQKLHVIAHYQGAKYADKVEILTDPEVFLEFRRHVLPQVLRGCATSGCHNSANERAYGFKLYNDPKKVPGTTYADFVVLSDYMLNGKRMIDRNDPSRSLLVTYMLPKSEVPPEFQHPGDVEIKPLFQSHKHRRFQRILKWIGSLKIPAEDYGVRLLPEPEMEADPFPPKSDDDEKKPADGDTPEPKKEP